MANTPENPPRKTWSSSDYRHRKAQRDQNRQDAGTPQSTEENVSGLQKAAEQMVRDRQLVSNAFQQATNPKPPKESESENKAAERLLEFATDPNTGKKQMVLHGAGDDKGKSKPTPGESDNPWHKRRDLLLTIIPSGLGGALAIFLWLAPPKNPLIIAFGLLAMFCFLAFPAVLGIHYFWRSRLAFVVGILVSALLTGGFGWRVWPAAPPPDWRRSDEAKQLASQMASDVQKLEDEGRLIDLTDYHRAIKVRAEWVEKCSVTLGRIDNQMRKFRRETTYKYYFEQSDSNVRKLLSDKNEDRTVFTTVPTLVEQGQLFASSG